jgi:hypothetical protein
MKAAIHCDVCGEVILEGKQLYYNNGVEDKDDGIDGEFFDGAGICETCGRMLCENCGDFDRDGRCAGCRKEEDGSDDGADTGDSP